MAEPTIDIALLVMVHRASFLRAWLCDWPSARTKPRYWFRASLILSFARWLGLSALLQCGVVALSGEHSFIHSSMCLLGSETGQRGRLDEGSEGGVGGTIYLCFSVSVHPHAHTHARTQEYELKEQERTIRLKELRAKVSQTLKSHAPALLLRYFVSSFFFFMSWQSFILAVRC